MRRYAPMIVVFLLASCGGASVAHYPHHRLDSDNAYLQAALRAMTPQLRSAFEHFLVANEVPPELSYDELRELNMAAGEAANAVVGDRDMLYLEEEEYNVAAALTEFEGAISDRKLALRPDLDSRKINAWAEALPPNPTLEEQERLYRKIVLGEED